MSQVFISYSSKDEAQAITIVDLLESQDIHCWIACRNLPAGASFPSEIPPVIRECPVFLLLLTHNSIQSMDVLNELTLASRYKKQHSKLILPLLLEDVALPDAFDYHLATAQIHPYDPTEDVCRIALIGTVQKHLRPKTDPIHFQNHWGSAIEAARNQFIAAFEEDMGNADPEELTLLHGLLNYMKTCTPKEFLETYIELAGDAFMNGIISVEDFKEEFMQTLENNQDKMPQEIVECMPVYDTLLSNLSPEEAAEFHKGLMWGLHAAELEAEENKQTLKAEKR